MCLVCVLSGILQWAGMGSLIQVVVWGLLSAIIANVVTFCLNLLLFRTQVEVLQPTDPCVKAVRQFRVMEDEEGVGIVVVSADQARSEAFVDLNGIIDDAVKLEHSTWMDDDVTFEDAETHPQAIPPDSNLPSPGVEVEFEIVNIRAVNRALCFLFFVLFVVILVWVWAMIPLYEDESLLSDAVLVTIFVTDFLFLQTIRVALCVVLSEYFNAGLGIHPNDEQILSAVPAA